jgi:general stress protein 26
MSELEERILAILKQPQLAGFATITTDGKPWVRYVMILGDDDMKIRFATFSKSRKIEQIKKNPEVHITCGVNCITEMMPYLQIQGIAKIATDQAEKVAFWNEELKDYFSGPDDPHYALVVIEPYRIEYINVDDSWGTEVWEK